MYLIVKNTKNMKNCRGVAISGILEGSFSAEAFAFTSLDNGEAGGGKRDINSRALGWHAELFLPPPSRWFSKKGEYKLNLKGWPQDNYSK